MKKQWERLVQYMRRTKLRVQHYFIKKLGGYTEQYQPPAQRVYVAPKPSLQIQRLIQEQWIAYPMLRDGGSERMKDYIKFAQHQIAHQMAEALVKGGVIFESSQDVIRNEVILCGAPATSSAQRKQPRHFIGKCRQSSPILMLTRMGSCTM